MAVTIENNTRESAEHVTFFVGDALFGIDILAIQEINRNVPLTKVPQAPNFIRGIVNLRGKIVTIIDLGKKLGLEPVRQTMASRNIIVNSQGEHIGLMVNRLGDVVSSENQTIEPAPSTLGRVTGAFFQGVLKADGRLIGLLDLDEILKD